MGFKKVVANISSFVPFGCGVLIGLRPWSPAWFSARCIMLRAENTAPDGSRSAQSALDALHVAVVDVLFFSHNPH